MAHPAHWPSTFRRIGVVLGVLGLALFTLLMAVFSPFALLLIPALAGGVVTALILLRRQFGSEAPTSLPQTFPGEQLSTDVINAAHIRVAGFGGLGLVAMSAVIAIAIPPIRMAMIVAIVGGAIAALVVVLYRRRNGPIESSSHGLPGARTMLIGTDDASSADAPARNDRPHHPRLDESAVVGVKSV